MVNFEGLRHVSVGLERMILFCYPTLVVLMSAAFLGTRLDRCTLASLVVCYAGLALALLVDFLRSAARLRAAQRQGW